MGNNYRTIEDRLELMEREILSVKKLMIQLLHKSGTEQKEDYSRLPLLNVREVCKLVRVEAAVIYAACTKGELKHMKVGKLYKFKREDVFVWAEKNSEFPMVDADQYVSKYLEKNILKR